MNLSDFIALLPIVILATGVVLEMLIIAFWRNQALIAIFTLIILLFAFLAVPFAAARGTLQVTPLLVFDSFAYFITGLIIAACFTIVLLSYRYFHIHPEKSEEFYLLLLSATVGSTTLAASNHFASFFLGLEILSISLYGMIGYTHTNPLSIEAGVKYLILAASSAAFLLFGMALIYATLGTMDFSRIASILATPNPNVHSIYFLAGAILMLVGFGYKLALVPFHMWTPDVYEGAPAPVTAFVASISKGSMFAVLIRFFVPLNIANDEALWVVFIIIAIATMLAGNLLALRQSNLKRLLAYSSIANLGYLLVAFLAGGANAITASTFYLVSYFITILAAFGVVTVLSTQSGDADQLVEYQGLMWRRPWLAGILAITMFSLAGLPLTVGFVGKFYLVLAGVGSALWLLVIVLVVSSAIGLYYYLRVVVTLFTRNPAQQASGTAAAPSFSLSSGLALAGLLVLLIWLGVYPSPILNLVQAITTTLH